MKLVRQISSLHPQNLVQHTHTHTHHTHAHIHTYTRLAQLASSNGCNRQCCICSFSSNMNHSHKRRFEFTMTLTNRLPLPRDPEWKNQLTLAFMGMVLSLIIHVTKFALLVTGANTFPSLASIDVSLLFSLWCARARTQKHEHEHESGVTR